MVQLWYSPHWCIHVIGNGNHVNSSTQLKRGAHWLLIINLQTQKCICGCSHRLKIPYINVLKFKNSFKCRFNIRTQNIHICLMKMILNTYLWISILFLKQHIIVSASEIHLCTYIVFMNEKYFCMNWEIISWWVIYK